MDPIFDRPALGARESLLRIQAADDAHTPASVGTSDRLEPVRQYGRWIWQEVRRLPQLPTAVMTARENHIKGAEIAALCPLLPTAQDFAAFYSADTVEERKLALRGLNVPVLKRFIHKLNQALSSGNRDSQTVTSIRKFVELLLGAGNDPASLRKHCRALYLNLHPDKVGDIDYGSPLANLDGQLMLRALNTAKQALSEPELVEKMFPGHGTMSSSGRSNWRLVVGAAVFFLGLVTALVALWGRMRYWFLAQK